MATFLQATIAQTTNEIRQWVADFTDDLAAGVTISSGTATHTPPYGSALTPVVAVDSPYISAQLGAGMIAGLHYLDVQATFSNGEKSEVRIAFTVNYPSTGIREGMAAIISDLRGMTDASQSDYTVAGIPYWSDKQLQDLLDKRRFNLRFVALEPKPDYSNGTVIYLDFALPVQNVESGTALQILDYSGSAIGTTAYSFDYNQSLVSFGTTQAGSAVYCNAHCYDLYQTAADVWHRKAAHYAVAYDISTDNHNLRRSQLIKQCQEAATLYETMGGPNTITMVRSDTVNPNEHYGVEPDNKRMVGGW